MAKLKKQAMREDQIGEAVAKAWEYTRTHVEYVGGGALVVVILVLAAVLFFQNRTKSESEALLPFDNAQGSYLQAQNPQDMEKAVAQFEEVSKRYGNTSSGRKALLYLGLCYRRLGAYDKAIPYFRSFLGKGGEKNDLLRAAGEACLAACYEDKGDYGEAGKLYSRMAARFEGDPLTATRALLAAGRCYESLGDFPAARKAYQEVLERFPASPRSYDARIALAMLPQGD